MNDTALPSESAHRTMSDFAQKTNKQQTNMNDSSYYEVDGYVVEVCKDELIEPENLGMVGQFYSNHRDYSPMGLSIEQVLYHDDDDTLRISPDYIWVKVYAYIHSGVALSLTPFSDKWDSGLFGIMAIHKDDANISGVNDYDAIINMLRQDVETLNRYYNEGWYLCTVEDPDGNGVFCCTGYESEEDAYEDALEAIKSDKRINDKVLTLQFSE